MKKASTMALVGWSLICMMIVLSGAVLAPGDVVKKASAKEAMWIEQSMGAKTLNMLNTLSSKAYIKIVDFDWVEFFKFKPEDLVDDPAIKKMPRLANVTKYINERMDSALDLLYWGLRRICLFLVLAPFWFPFLLLSLMHGYYKREIKKTDFQYTSPVFNHYARRAISWCTLIVIGLTLAPVPIDPWVVMFLIGVAISCAGVALANVQKQI